uniref:Uncharacterized protein n=1 Tax=Vespula pensylvanica TaxID=30213 RepID=A0A834PG15_VESPE|nr:hypothetical protein H0235_000882 [Vespula pensylvanica]
MRFKCQCRYIMFQRFSEDVLRSEKQTKLVGGLRHPRKSRDVVIESPDRGQSPNGRSPKAKPASIHRSQSLCLHLEAQSIPIPFVNNLRRRSARSRLNSTRFSFQVVDEN